MSRKHGVILGSCMLLASAVTPASAALKHLDKAVRNISGELIGADFQSGSSVAVLPFRNLQGEATELGRLVSDALTLELLKTKRCTTLDRDYVSRMLDEIKLGMTGAVDQKTAVQVGKFSGARYLLVGTLEPYGQKEVLLQARLLETESAKLIASSRAEVKMDDEMWGLYSRRIALDAASAALLGGKEEKADPDVTLLNQTGKDGCQWIEAKAAVSFKSDRDAARASAITLARHKALRKVLGKAPQASPDFEEEAFTGQIENVLRATLSGRSGDEKVVEEGPAGKQYKVTFQACLKPRRENADKDFRVELLLNQNRFVEGQEARAILSSTRDGYVYLYSVDFDGKAGLVFPIKETPDNKVSAGKPFIFPSEEDRKSVV
jgi:TolB-like protein